MLGLLDDLRLPTAVSEPAWGLIRPTDSQAHALSEASTLIRLVEAR